jgi:hypothetical protein
MKLTKASRNAIPAGKFAGPNRTYPIPDKSHARAALSGASHALHVGNISAHEAAVIQAAARQELKK